MEDVILQRVKAVQNRLGLSANALAKAIGMNQVTLNDYLRGNRKVSLALVTKILETYPEISAEWLLRGEGEMEKVYTHVTEESPNEFQQGLEELRRRVSDLERQSSSTAEAV